MNYLLFLTLLLATCSFFAQNKTEQPIITGNLNTNLLGLLMDAPKEKVLYYNQNTYLFLCTTLEEFINEIIKKKSIDGARIISAPANKYIVSTITL
jgi:hypothetical protein